MLSGSAILGVKISAFGFRPQRVGTSWGGLAALRCGKPQRVTNASDDTDLKMGDYFDLAADLYGLPRPTRVSRSDAKLQLPAMQLSFMSESRRLSNQRLKQELRIELRFPTVAEGLKEG